ncbi:MAG TPA: RNA-binding protein [Chitinophagaceae bacterium]|jgi:RNA recognition motif-containing protein|nr:RNA-binding protein [Chitinophagaceae bacterium]
MNIYISNLSFNIQDKDLSGFFAEYGEVSSAKVIMDKVTSRSRGFGFVEMSDEEASKKAIAGLDGTTKDGRTIKVTEARQKADRPAYRDNDDGGYNNSNSYNKNRY